MKALKIVAIIAVIVGLGWIIYLTVFDTVRELKPELLEDEDKEKEEEIKKEEEEDPDYTPSKILDVKTEEDIEKEKKEVKINTPLDPFGKELQKMEESNFKSVDPDEYPGGIDASVKQNGT